MITLLALLHIIVCFILILVVLLQSGSKADLAGAFGGSSTQTAFGSRGPASFLNKLTVGCAVLFMITCLGLTLYSTRTERTVIPRDNPAPVKKSTPGPRTPTGKAGEQKSAPSESKEAPKQP